MNDIPCPECKGVVIETAPPCPRCHGRGCELLTSCPFDIITPDVDLAIDAADDLANNAGWPHGGGWLHERQILVEAVRFARDTNARFKARVINSPQF
jgi:hypothetical protein